MNLFDIIVNEHAGKEDRYLLHKILENQYLLIHKNKEIMNQLDQLKTALAAESVSVETLAKAYSDLVTKLNNLPPDDSDALKALTDEANADIARISGVLNPPVTTDPGTGTTDPGTGTTTPPVDTTPPADTTPPVTDAPAS